MKRALFVTYGGGHSAIIQRLVAQASRMGYEAHVLALTVTAPQFVNLDCKVYGFRDFCGDLDGCRDTLRFYGLEKDVQRHPAVPEGETEAYLAMSFLDLVEECGEKEALHRYHASGRGSFLPIRTLRRIVSEIEPDLVVATSAPRAERAAIEAASAMGIPAVCVVDLFAVAESRWVARPDFGSAVCVLSESVRESLIRQGRPPENVHVTGNPAFDDIFEERVGEKAEAMRERNGWQNKKVILWAAPPEIRSTHPGTGEKTDPDLPRRIMESLVSIQRKSNGTVQVVFRPHPSTPASHFEEVAEGVYLSDSAEDVDQVVLASDMVIVTNSTVALMASLCRKDVIAVYVPGYTEAAPLAEMGFATHADDEHHMGALIEKWLESGFLPGTRKDAEAGARATEAVWEVCLSVDQ